MNSTVAIVHIQGNPDGAMRQAISLLGGIDDLNAPDRDVTIKVGIFDPRCQHHTTVPLVKAIAGAFEKAPHVRVVESDNYCGKALDRLERFRDAFSERVTPASLSEGPEIKQYMIAGEAMGLSTHLMKPNVLVSTHVLRTFMMGSIIKNLFGCTPMVKKSKYHKKEIFSRLLADIAETAGGIDLAVLDGTYLSHGASDRRVPLDILIVGRDPVAVETVGASIAGLKPEKMAGIQEFARRGMGVADLDQIGILGFSEEEFAQLKKSSRELKKVVEAAPRQPGVSDTIDQLTQAGWLDTFRTVEEVVVVLQEQGVKNATKVLVDTTLKRRVGKTLERVKDGGKWMFRRKLE